MAALAIPVKPLLVSRSSRAKPRARQPLTLACPTKCNSSAAVRIGSQHFLSPSLFALGGVVQQNQTRSRAHKRLTTCGLPIPVIVFGALLSAGFIFTPFTVALLYFAAAVRFWFNYKRTVYSQAITTRVALTALWPVLVIISSTYRQNFSKAVKGG